ncbi:MAG: biotin--[acetyl-CoA-carboxylase] ligase [Thermomicrobiales bacterium]|nr:biotin--[acetyl-CoA-carboxylase] ligase [Thermomicrobiales bacterium]
MIGRTRWHFRSVDSTQNLAFALAQMGANAGTVVRAEFQRAGRGRLGRSWKVPSGTSLMFSTILRPDYPVHQLGSLSLAIADALAGVFAPLVDGDVRIKWPNDVLIDGQKVSGILLQTRMLNALVAVVGIGINVAQQPDQLPEGATSLTLASAQLIDRERLFDDILTALNTMNEAWTPMLAPEIVARIESKLYLKNQPVTIIDAEREITGIIAGIAPTGELRLIVAGHERWINAGEIQRGPRATTPDS